MDPTVTLPLGGALHHGTHRQLLRMVSAMEVPGARVDAIVVPAARPVDSLNEALTLAADLKCGVVVLCSQRVTATQAVAAGNDLEIPVIALDLEHDSYGLPEFMTDKVPGDFARFSDTSIKRNLGLVLAKVAGWERLLFLDDDIHHITRSGVRAAAALADNFDVVGLENYGYPDNSVVCHTFRELEYSQEQFIGVGAMAVNTQSNRSFFPNIYNQDWMFMLGCGSRPQLAVTGYMKQDQYDPFVDPDRARREELGDCLAEGLYWLLDDDRSVESAKIDHWAHFLKRRSYFIKHLIARVTAGGYESAWTGRVLESLGVAQETNSKVCPEDCVEFVDRWRSDLATWLDFVNRLSTDLGVAEALEYVRWPAVLCSDYPWPVLPAATEDRLIFSNGWERAAAD